MKPTRNLKTPIIKPRVQGGTFYTFSSALEDIGLNINENHNKVALTHYALLEIPDFGIKGKQGTFDTLTITDFPATVNKGDYSFAEGFENFTLNFETVLRNQDTYNFTASKTVSERVFWKWLAKSCVDFQVDSSNSSYYGDTNEIVKCVGEIASSAQRSDDYGLYNETFVQIPSSYGQMKVLYKKTEDNNCYVSTASIYGTTATYIENVTDDDRVPVTGGVDPDKLNNGMSSHAIYDTSTYYTISGEDCMEVVTDINEYRKYYGDTTLTFDDLSMDDSKIVGRDFDFNAILFYYSVYDSEGNSILATNAYGILILNSAEETSSTGIYRFPALSKKMSTSTASGTSYSFRLNVKTTSVYSTQIVTNDNATAAYSMSTDFNDVIRNLGTAVDILASNANLISKIYSDNITIKGLAAEAIDEVERIKVTVNRLSNGIFSKISTPVLDASTASIGTMDASISFVIPGTVTDTSVGSIDGSIFTYDVINAVTSMSAPSADISSISVSALSNSSQVDVSVAGNNVMSISSSGTYNNNPYLFKHAASANPNTLTANEVDMIMNCITIGYPTGSPEQHSLFIDTTQVLTSANAAAVRDSLISNGYVNMSNLLALILIKLKYGEGFRWQEPNP